MHNATTIPGGHDEMLASVARNNLSRNALKIKITQNRKSLFQINFLCWFKAFYINILVVTEFFVWIKIIINIDNARNGYAYVLKTSSTLDCVS